MVKEGGKWIHQIIRILLQCDNMKVAVEVKQRLEIFWKKKIFNYKKIEYSFKLDYEAEDCFISNEGNPRHVLNNCNSIMNLIQQAGTCISPEVTNDV